VNGVKISKSLGNAVDPLELADRYGVDAVRYFLLREVPYGQDGDFSEEKMKERYNADLANGLGNFAARVLTLAEKEALELGPLDADFEKEITAMKAAVAKKMQEFKFNDALAAIWVALSFGDRSINEEKVWAIEDVAARRRALFNLVTLLDNVAAALAPFLPEASQKITAALQWEGKTLHAKKTGVLFPRVK
jgi:methionyl-tRNA synthetase